MAIDQEKDSHTRCAGGSCPGKENGGGNDTGRLPWFLRILNEDWGNGSSFDVVYTDSELPSEDRM